jgi:hypothetical protein
MKDLNRKQIKKYIFLIIFFTIGISTLLAQSGSSQGSDFWVAFGQNRGQTPTTSGFYLKVRLVATQKDTVTFNFVDNLTTMSASQRTQTFYLNAGEVRTISFNPTEMEAVYTENTSLSTKKITKKSVHITSKYPISVYVLNYNTNTSDAITDATNILPTPALGNEYYHVGYTNSSPTYGKDALLIIATETGNTVISDESSTVATLTQGQVLYWAAGYSELNGRHFTADKNFAYFNVHQLAKIPATELNGDIMFQQFSPVNSWGKTFIVPLTAQNGGAIKIVASEASTSVTYKIGAATPSTFTLAKGEVREIIPVSGICYITSNKPIGVCHFMLSQVYGGPSMVWVPPVEQRIRQITIAPFALQSSAPTHFALIITPSGNKAETYYTVGGVKTAFGLSGWSEQSGYSVRSYTLSNVNASYTFENTEGVIVLVAGLGNFESYYYVGGIGAYNLNTDFFVNDIFYEDVNGVAFCNGTVKLRTAHDYTGESLSAGYLKWYINDVLIDSLNNKWNNFNVTLTNGTYNIKLVVNNNSANAESTNIIIDIPNAIINGTPNIEIGGTTTLSPSTGGTWVSNNSTIATVSNDGTVTGNAVGTATFTFTSNNGCSATTGTVTVKKTTRYLRVNPHIRTTIKQ